MTEALRLAELASFGVLDTPSEPAFDAVAQAAAQIAGCPTALVSFLDSDRQWFKARYGLDLTQIPRELGLCEYVLSTDAPLVVPDTKADVRFANNPLVIGEPKVRFYAGFPLRTTSGAMLGTLCVLDSQARPQGLTAGQTSLLSLLADQIMVQLELRRTLTERNATVQALEVSQKRYQALADNASDVVSQHALDGTTTYVSPAIESVLGYDPVTELGIVPQDRVHEQDVQSMEHAVLAVLAGTPTSVLIRSRHADGTWRHLDIRLSPVRDAQGQVVALHSVARDVSDRQAALELLRLSESRFRALFENNPIGQVEMSPHGVIQHVNAAFADLVGLESSTLIGLTPAWSTVLDQRGAQRQALEAARSEPGRVLRTERTLVRPDGTKVDVAGTITAVAGADGLTAVIIGATVDITENNRHAGQMRQLADELAAARDEAVRRNALTDTVLDTVNVGIAACDAAGNVTLFNRMARDLHGLSADPDLDLARWADHCALFAEDGTTRLTSDAVPLFRALAEGAIEAVIVVIAPVGVPTRVVRCDGRALRDMSGQLLGAVVVMADITQARAATRELAEQAAFTRVLLETAHSAIWACDASGSITYRNQTALQFLEGPSVAAVTSGLRFYGPDGRELTQEELPLYRALVEDEVRDVELVLATSDGERRSLLVHASAIRDVNDVLIGAVATAHDVSDLRASEARFRAAFHDGPTPVARLDSDGVILEVNPALRRLLGTLSSRLVGVALTDHTYPEDREPLQLALKGPGTGSEPVELRFLRVDGTAVWCELATTAASGPDGYVLAQLLDIDARKNHEIALERAAQHDPLTGLGNRAQLLQRVEVLLNPRAEGAAGLLFVDLDGFKAVNDAYGHEAGDAVLVEVAARLRETVRPGDVVVRLGGDEFVVVCALPTATTDLLLRTLAVRVEAAIAAPFEHGGTQLFVGGSVGVAVAPAGQDLQALLDAADRDMYLRKRERRAAGGKAQN